MARENEEKEKEEEIKSSSFQELMKITGKYI